MQVGELHSVSSFHLGGGEKKRAEYSTAEYWQVAGFNPALPPAPYRAPLLTATSSHKWSAQTANM